MTILTNLAIKNFKSFRKAEMPFSPGFTAIAGANGSGKSNILDAILFALGATSLKMLRASRLTELVNNDSSEGYAKVELTLNSRGKDIKITRIIDTQGRSIFKIDEKKKTLNEVQSLLLELEVNPNGHNIVVQGDVTRVIEMNAKQRLGVIEEVAGLQEFEEKKEEALKKLEQVEGKVKDALLVLSEREAYLKQIETDKDNAVRYNNLQTELKNSKATIVSEELRLTRHELDRAKEKIAGRGKEIEMVRQERSKLQEEEIGLEKKAEEITQKLIHAAEKTYSNFGKEAEQRRGQINLLNERLNGKEESLQYNKQRILELNSGIGDLEKLMKEKATLIAEAEKAIANTGDELGAMRASLHSKGPEFDKRGEAIKSKQGRFEGLDKELDKLKEQMHYLLVEKHGIERDTKLAAQGLQELELAAKKLDDKAREKRESEKRLQTLRAFDPDASLEAREREIEKIVSEMNHSRGRVALLEEALSTVDRARCPTCEKVIDKNLRERLVSKRSKEISALRQRVKELEAAKEKAIAEKEKAKAGAKELSGLMATLKTFQGVDSELSVARRHIEEAKGTINSKRLPELSLREAELKKRIDAYEREKASLRAALEEFRNSEANTQVSQLLAKLNELNDRKAEQEKAIAKMSAELEHSLTEKKAALSKESMACEKGIIEAQKAISEIRKEKAIVEKELGQMDSEMEKSAKANKVLEDEKARITAKIAKVSENRDKLSEKAESLEKEVNELNIQQSRNFVRASDLEEEIKDYVGAQPVEKCSLNDLKKRIPEIEGEIDKIGPVNMKALQDFDPFKREVDEMRGRAAKLDEERKAVLEMIDKINVRKFSVFIECFEQVSSKFSELYKSFFGGDGMLGLTDEINPFDGGLLIQAKYKEGVMKSIDAMSGGEKSLTALAFLFAIQSFEPAPFYILDEVDAALDRENSVKVANMVKSLCEKSQFIAISHNDAVINQADQIVGVALNKQKSSIIGLRLRRGEGGEVEVEGEPQSA